MGAVSFLCSILLLFTLFTPFFASNFAQFLFSRVEGTGV